MGSHAGGSLLLKQSHVVSLLFGVSGGDESGDTASDDGNFRHERLRTKWDQVG